MLPVMAARLGAGEFGRLSFIVVWAALLSIIVEGGFLAAATRVAVSADPAKRWTLAQQIFTARCVLCLPVVLLAIIVAWSVRKPSVAAQGLNCWLDASAIAALAIVLGWPATWYLQATQQLNRWSRIEIAVHLAAVLLFVTIAHSVATYVLIQGAAAAALAILGWRWLYRDLVRSAERARLWSCSQLVPGLRLGWTMMPVSIAGAAYTLALPAIGSRQMSSAELGHYFLVDRIVRALTAAIDPVVSVIYPRIVHAFENGEHEALRYASRWALFGGFFGMFLLTTGLLIWPTALRFLPLQSGGMDHDRLCAIFMVLGLLLPMLMGWKFFGYWMLGSGRYDHAYRLCIVIGAGIGLFGAAVAGTTGALGLAWTAIASEAGVVITAIAGVYLTRRATSRMS
ncbi:lipopolysaccharide biosynthesis protein [Variovorax soli]